MSNDIYSVNDEIWFECEGYKVSSLGNVIGKSGRLVYSSTIKLADRQKKRRVFVAEVLEKFVGKHAADKYMEEEASTKSNETVMLDNVKVIHPEETWYQLGRNMVSSHGGVKSADHNYPVNYKFIQTGAVRMARRPFIMKVLFEKAPLEVAVRYRNHTLKNSDGVILDYEVLDEYKCPYYLIEDAYGNKEGCANAIEWGIERGYTSNQILSALDGFGVVVDDGYTIRKT